MKWAILFKLIISVRDDLETLSCTSPEFGGKKQSWRGIIISAHRKKLFPKSGFLFKQTRKEGNRATRFTQCETIATVSNEINQPKIGRSVCNEFPGKVLPKGVKKPGYPVQCINKSRPTLQVKSWNITIPSGYREVIPSG